MKQMLLKIGLPVGVLLYPSKFRELLAKDSTVPRALFHRTTNGKTGEGLPAVRIIGGRGWVGILCDESTGSLVMDVMGIAVKAVSAFVGAPVRVSLEEHEAAVSPVQSPMTYWVREMAIKTRSVKRKSFLTGDAAPMIEDVLQQSLGRFADYAGLDLPSASQLDLRVHEITQNQPLRLITTSGPTQEFVRMVSASFTVFANLKGFWSAGNLTSRGYGRIGVDLKTLAVNAEREARSPRRAVN